MGDYRPQEIEAKWQKRWEEHRVFETEAELDGTSEEEKSKPAPSKPEGAAPAEETAEGGDVVSTFASSAILISSRISV